jgi:hypothetical protein
MFLVTLQTVKGTFNCTVRLRTMATFRTSYKPICKALGILAVPSQHILPLRTFLVNKLKYVTSNFSLHSTNTGMKLQLHRLMAHFTSFHKGEYYANTNFHQIIRIYCRFNKG